MTRTIVTIEDYAALAEEIAPRGSRITAEHGVYYSATVNVRPPWWWTVLLRGSCEELAEQLAEAFHRHKPITTRVVIRVHHTFALDERIIT